MTVTAGLDRLGGSSEIAKRRVVDDPGVASVSRLWHRCVH